MRGNVSYLVMKNTLKNCLNTLDLQLKGPIGQKSQARVLYAKGILHSKARSMKGK